MEQAYTIGEYAIPRLSIGEVTLTDRRVSVLSERPFPRDRIVIGFMGSAGKEKDTSGKTYALTEDDKKIGILVGKIIAANGAILSNGAVWGIPYFPVKGANTMGGYTFGISPYSDRESHVSNNPLKHFDLVFYAGIKYPENPRATFTFRDWINTLFVDIAMSAGGRLGTPDEVFHILEQGGIYIPIRGSGGATDWLIKYIEKEEFKKNTGARVIIADKTPQSLESAIKEALEEAQRRWQAEGRNQNRFSHVVDKLEAEMEAGKLKIL